MPPDRDQALAVFRANGRPVEEWLKDPRHGLFLHAMGGRLLEVNEAACRDLGYSRAELLGMPIARWESNHNPDDIRQVWPTLPPGAPHFSYGVHLHKSGRPFPVWVESGVLEHGGLKIMYGRTRPIARKTPPPELAPSEPDADDPFFEASAGALFWHDASGTPARPFSGRPRPKWPSTPFWRTCPRKRPTPWCATTAARAAPSFPRSSGWRASPSSWEGSWSRPGTLRTTGRSTGASRSCCSASKPTTAASRIWTDSRTTSFPGCPTSCGPP